MTYQEWQLNHYRGIRPANEADLRAAWDAATVAASKAYTTSEDAANASEKASDASEAALKSSAKATMLTAEMAEMAKENGAFQEPVGAIGKTAGRSVDERGSRTKGIVETNHSNARRGKSRRFKKVVRTKP